MKKILAIIAIATLLASCAGTSHHASCGTNYYACPGVDGGRPVKSCGR